MASRAEIEIKDSTARHAAKYQYMVKDKAVVHQGETVEDFLKRGGKITKVYTKVKKTIDN